jgi:hypothetical protein
MMSNICLEYIAIRIVGFGGLVKKGVAVEQWQILGFQVQHWSHDFGLRIMFVGMLLAV